MKKTRAVSQIGVFGALSFIIMLFVIPFPLAPWLKFDIADVVVLFSGLVGGLGVGIAVTFVKVLIHTFITSTQSAGIGELTSIVATLSYIIPAIFIYKKTKNIILALFCGTILMTVIMLIGNYYYITPFYAKLFQIEFILHMIERQDGSYLKYIIIYYGGFNIFKGIVQSIIYYLLHRKLKDRYIGE